MRILFDHSTPAPLRRLLGDHSITEAIEMGWHRLSNGKLLSAAEDAGFDVLITADKNIRYQQNLAGRRIAIIELGNSRWPIVQLYTDRIVEALTRITPGCYLQVEIPFR